MWLLSDVTKAIYKIEERQVWILHADGTCRETSLTGQQFLALQLHLDPDGRLRDAMCETNPKDQPNNNNSTTGMRLLPKFFIKWSAEMGRPIDQQHVQHCTDLLQHLHQTGFDISKDVTSFCFFG